MHIVIAGGSGFVGAHLTAQLYKMHHKITLLTHQEVEKTKARLDRHYYWDYRVNILRYEDYDGQGDVFINFAGESIGAKPVTTRRLKTLLNSRINVLEQLSHLITMPPVMIQASAVAVYPNSDEVQNEKSPTLDLETSVKDEPLAAVALKTEAKAQELNEQFKFRNFYITRFGIVLGRHGGFIKKASFMPPFTVIHGVNKVPFIELDDACNALIMLINEQAPSGIINLTSPQSATLKELLHCCYKHSPLPQIPIITGLLKLGDQRSKLLKANQNIMPQALLDAGFKFARANIQNVE